MDGESKELTTPAEAAPETLVDGAERNEVAGAHALAEEVAARIAAEFDPTLERNDRNKVVAAFRRVPIPRRPPGRPPKETVTAAYQDWKVGLRGVELYHKHIPDWQQHSKWRRESEARALREAIRARERREQRRKQNEKERLRCILTKRRSRT
jgi:hypothetical protein